MICNLKKKKYFYISRFVMKLNKNLYAKLPKQFFMKHTNFVFNSQKKVVHGYLIAVVVVKWPWETDNLKIIQIVSAASILKARSIFNNFMHAIIKSITIERLII